MVMDRTAESRATSWSRTENVYPLRTVTGFFVIVIVWALLGGLGGPVSRLGGRHGVWAESHVNVNMFALPFK